MSDLVPVELASEDDVGGFWAAIGPLLQERRKPEHIVFEVAGGPKGLFGSEQMGRQASPGKLTDIKLPDELKKLAQLALLHADPERFALVCRLASRAMREPWLLSVASDADVTRVRDLAKAVRRDKHKMTAFVRFRETVAPDGEPVFVSWFEPAHHIVRDTAPFFVRRFASMRWSILTPRASAHWDGHELTIGPGTNRHAAAPSDPLERVWKTYYANIFNPARVMPEAMRAEMPRKYWKNLPEAELIGPLIAQARERTSAMIATPPSMPRRTGARGGVAVQPNVLHSRPADLPALAGCAASCTRCSIGQSATQLVPGEGPADAALMIVGEQPGDQEDLEGRPFVGPAGKVLDIALSRAGIDRRSCYLTNAVKHFKYEPRGKRRIHKTPSASEIDHCRWWLDEEIRLVRPRLIITLGATALRGVLGPAARLSEMRGRVVLHGTRPPVAATVHPAYLLRLREEQEKRTQWRSFLDDLRMAAAATVSVHHSPVTEDFASMPA